MPMLTFKDIIESKNLVYFAGAGCSVDPPSNLPPASQLIIQIVKFLCPKAEVRKILNLREFRLESLLGILTRTLDNDLDILKYYGLCNSPNSIHFFLAEMIKKHNIVITTNFDHLIELALLKLGIPKHKIITVITEMDFIRYTAPEKLFSQGKFPIYKLHGSIKDIISNEETVNSLKTTFNTLIKGRSAFNLFGIDSFKKKLFDHLRSNYTLILLGYSGKDDFDLTPALLQIKKLDKIIWITHTSEIEQEQMLKIEKEQDLSKLELEKGLDILIKEIMKKGITSQLYIIKGKTKQILSRINNRFAHESSETLFNLDFERYLIQNLPNPNYLVKLYNAHRIYHELEHFDDSIRIALKIIEVCNQKKRLLEWEEWLLGLAYANTGSGYAEKGELSKSLDYLNKGIKIITKSKNDLELSVFYTDRATVLSSLARFKEALRDYKKALQYAKKNNNQNSLSTIYYNIANLYQNIGDNDQAKTYLEKAKLLAEKLGNIHHLASILNVMGMILANELEFEGAETCYQQALEIFDSIKLESSKIDVLGNMAIMNINLKKHSEAIKLLEQALEICYKYEIDKTDFLYSNLGKIYIDLEDYVQAKNYYNLALQKSEREGNLLSIGIRMNNLADIDRLQGNFNDAMDKFKEVLQISQENNYSRLKGVVLNNIGLLLKSQGKLKDALKYYRESIDIAFELNDVQFLIERYYNLGYLYIELRNHQAALECFNNAKTIQAKVE
jgi:tetratricopeptide (TPR) repeat protein